MTNKFPLKKVVEVVWRDSMAIGRWNSLEVYKDADVCLCRSVGYLVRRDKSRLTLMQSQSSNSGVADSITIPSECVRKVRVLR